MTRAETIDRDTMLLLMQFADGELEGGELERAEKLVEDDARCAELVSQILGLSGATHDATLARVPVDFDVAGQIMAAVDAPTVSTAAAANPRVVPMRRAPPRAAMAVGVAILALAAAALLYNQTNQTAQAVKAPGTTQEVVPEGPAPKDELKQELASNGSSGVDVNSVESPQNAVSVFVLPGSNASASSVVVWIDEPSGSE